MDRDLDLAVVRLDPSALVVRTAAHIAVVGFDTHGAGGAIAFDVAVVRFELQREMLRHLHREAERRRKVVHGRARVVAEDAQRFAVRSLSDRQALEIAVRFLLRVAAHLDSGDDMDRVAGLPWGDLDVAVVGLAVQLRCLCKWHVDLNGLGGGEAGVRTRHCEQRHEEQGLLHGGKLG